MMFIINRVMLLRQAPKIKYLLKVLRNEILLQNWGESNENSLAKSRMMFIMMSNGILTTLVPGANNNFRGKLF